MVSKETVQIEHVNPLELEVMVVAVVVSWSCVVIICWREAIVVEG